MKHCSSCNQDKCKSQFGRRTASIDGLAAKCKACQKEYDKKRANNPDRVEARKLYAKTHKGIEAANRAWKKYAEKNKEKIAEARKKYVENNKEKIAEIHRNYVKLNPKKRSAHKVVEGMVRRGELSISPCEDCGSLTVHAHHDDYAKQSVVRWLCSKHHKKWHSENGEGLNAR